MASLATTHKEYILEQLMQEYLHQGIVPTSTQLETDLETYMEEHPNLEVPTSKIKDWSVEPGENSSAAQMHDIADTISQDVGVITREIYRIAQDGSRFYDRWSNEMKRLSAFARRLEQRTDSLLLLNADTMGFFAYVGDVFADMNQIDTDETDARVDLHETTVTIDPAVTEVSASGSLIDLSHITEQDVTFRILSKRPGITFNHFWPLMWMYKTASRNPWLCNVSSDSSNEVICEVVTRLGHKDLEVSRINVQFTGPNGTTHSTVTCMYSVDGYTWHLVPSADTTKAMVSNVTWVFPLTTMRWIKFVLRKTAPDNVDNNYQFQIYNIKLYGNEYDSSVGNTLVSNSLQALDAEGNSTLFSLLALNTCQELADGTGIDFSVAASQDNVTWTDWMPIAPSESTNILYPKIINLSGADWKDNTSEDDAVFLDNTVTLDGNAQRKIVTTFSDSDFGYRFHSSDYGVVNTGISISTGEDPDPIGNSVIVWRNVRYRDPLAYPDITTVRDNIRGWGFNGGEYSCYFEIIDSNGKTIDFGDRECSIDGTKVSGVTTIPVGVHKFTTKSDNWHDISSDYLVLYPTAASGGCASQEILESIDPLYPYNHKLLIEGFPYPTGKKYQGDRIYTGTDISAEFYATRASLFDLENNLLGDDQYGYFSVRSVGDAASPTLAVVTRFDISNPDYANELFTVKWRSGTTDASMYKYVKLKAQLWTTNIKVSPVLTSYRIKLGV